MHRGPPFLPPPGQTADRGLSPLPPALLGFCQPSPPPCVCAVGASTTAAVLSQNSLSQNPMSKLKFLLLPGPFSWNHLSEQLISYPRVCLSHQGLSEGGELFTVPLVIPAALAFRIVASSSLRELLPAPPSGGAGCMSWRRSPRAGPLCPLWVETSYCGR